MAGFFILAAFYVQAAPLPFVFNKNCEKAYELMISMRFDDARTLLHQVRKEQPDNLIPVLIENYEDFLRCAFNEDKEEFERLYVNKDKRLTLLSKGDTKSPYYLFSKAQVSLQWALVNLKFENYTAAFFDIRRAYLMLEENQRLFPEFRANLIGLGFLHALIGTVPDSYKWAARMMGFNGTVIQGKNEMLEAIRYGNKNEFVFHTEAKYMYLILQLIVLNDKQGAYETVMSNHFPSQYGNALSCFTKGYVALKNFKNDEAITYFTYNIFNNRTWALYNYYLLGMCQLNKLNTEAYHNLKYFSDYFKGVNYIKDARHRMAWCALLKGKRDEYLKALPLILERGNTLSDSDKSAQWAATKKLVPHTELLKARLLMDGGYLQEAMQVLIGLGEEHLNTAEHKTEQLYRRGRIYHLQSKTEEAKVYYEKSIAVGKDLPVYFAANAAMELGSIYEKEGNKEQAKYYYKLSLSMPDSDFKNSIDVRSKAGLQRIGG